MKIVVIYDTAGSTLDQLRAVFPRHKALIDEASAQGDLIAIGPYGDRSGALAVYRTREAAEAFVARDPFVVEGLVGKVTFQDWNEILLG